MILCQLMFILTINLSQLNEQIVLPKQIPWCDVQFHLSCLNLVSNCLFDFFYIHHHFWLRCEHLLFILTQYVQVRFGTLSEYFTELEKSQTRPFPTFAGDFFPYSDRSDQYWTGFYTSRPHLKYFARRIQSLLRLYSQYFVMTILWS